MKKLDIGKKPLISQIIFMCVYFYYVYYLQKNKCECIDSNRNHLIQKLYMLQLILMLVITYSNFSSNLSSGKELSSYGLYNLQYLLL